MAQESDHDRIARKAHELWEQEGRPHGRDLAHWEAAKEIIALEDSYEDTLLPRDAGAEEPEEPEIVATNQGEMPVLTDQGRDDLVSTDREPEVTRPGPGAHSVGDTAGGLARPSDRALPQGDEPGTVTRPAPKVAPVTPTPSKPTLGEPAPRSGSVTGPGAPRKEARPQSVTKGRSDKR